MDVPQMTWSDLPVWVWALLALPLWYVVIGRAMAAGFFDVTTPDQDASDRYNTRVMFWLLSPVLVPLGLAIIAVVFAWVAGSRTVRRAVLTACVIFPPESRKDDTIDT